jgi:23S rRNA pseudouridine1911/1915/1917 synthase
MSEQLLSFTCQPGEDGRLDKFLVAHLAELSRSRLQSLIKDGFVTVNSKAAVKSSATVEVGQSVEIHVPASVPTALVPENIQLDIVFENKDLMVVNKPAGMVVHPAAGHSSGTLVHAALGHAPEMEGIGGELRPGVVHRLDKDTSGLILLAKNDQAHNWLQSQFKSRRVEKIYLALVDGAPPTPTGRVEAAIGRDSAHRKQMAVVPAAKGREAITEYRILESFANHTLVEAHPLTGRTHQIRLHMAYIHCPIAGDTIYGHHKSTVELKRHFLHAARLTIVLPGESEARTFEAALPKELVEVLDKLRKEN